MAEQDHYAALGLRQDATRKEVREAFRRLAPEHHPDRNGGTAESEERFKAISVAHTILSDPTERERYDTRVAATAAVWSIDPYVTPAAIEWAVGSGTASLAPVTIHLCNRGGYEGVAAMAAQQMTGAFWWMDDGVVVLEDDELCAFVISPRSTEALSPGVHRDTVDFDVDGQVATLTIRLTVAATGPASRPPGSPASDGHTLPPEPPASPKATAGPGGGDADVRPPPKVAASVEAASGGAVHASAGAARAWKARLVVVAALAVVAIVVLPRIVPGPAATPRAVQRLIDTVTAVSHGPVVCSPAQMSTIDRSTASADCRIGNSVSIRYSSFSNSSDMDTKYESGLQPYTVSYGCPSAGAWPDDVSNLVRGRVRVGYTFGRTPFVVWTYEQYNLSASIVGYDGSSPAALCEAWRRIPL